MKTTILGTPTWRAKQDVLTSLWHRTVRSSYTKNSTVHLGSTRYHVLSHSPRDQGNLRARSDDSPFRILRVRY